MVETPAHVDGAGSGESIDCGVGAALDARAQRAPGGAVEERNPACGSTAGRRESPAHVQLAGARREERVHDVVGALAELRGERIVPRAETPGGDVTDRLAAGRAEAAAHAQVAVAPVAVDGQAEDGAVRARPDGLPAVAIETSDVVAALAGDRRESAAHVQLTVVHGHREDRDIGVWAEAVREGAYARLDEPELAVVGVQEHLVVALVEHALVVAR